MSESHEQLPSGRAPASALRVAFVVHKMQVAGAEVLVRETIRRLGERIEATVICLDDLGQMGHEMLQEGHDVRSLDRSPGLDLRVAAGLAATLHERRIQLVHAHQYGPFFYSALARIRGHKGGGGQKPRILLTEHGRHYPDVVRPRRRWANRLLLARFADGITACSDFSRRALARNDGFPLGRVEVIENGIELAHYEPRSRQTESERQALAQRLGLDPDRRYVLCVARFHSVKDHSTLLEAYAQVAQKWPTLDLALAGDGPLRQSLETQAAELGLSSRIRFLGVRQDVPQLLQAAEIFALNSLSEAASLTLLEAMAVELPVVVTDVGGNPEMVEQEVHGLRVARSASEETANALARLLEAPDWGLELGRRGRQQVERRYQLKHTVDRYDSLYRKLV